MAAAPWNRVNIPFPSAISSVRIAFTSETDKTVKSLMAEVKRVQRLMGSEMLQTETRVLNELLHVLNNSFRGKKAFKGIKQVGQCVNRLEDMKLDVALHDLMDGCPQNVQRKLGVQTGECDVPSQPTLEWVGLKVLGAAQLSTCTLTRCSRAFLLVRQQMRWSEFLVLNMVLTSLLSRLWVIFRGLLFCLSASYRQLLELLRAVSQARPVSFLTDFSLPGDLVEFLGPSEAPFLTRHPTFIKNLKRKKTTPPAEVKNKRRKVKEDLGVAIERGVVFDSHLKPIFNIFKNAKKVKSLPEENQELEIQKFQKKTRNAASFSHLATQLEEMICWSRNQRRKKEEQLLSFLSLKCKRMKCLERTELSVHRKLSVFRRLVCWALSPRGSIPKTFRSFAAVIKSSRRKTRFQFLKERLRVRIGVRRKPLRKTREGAEVTTPLLSKKLPQNRTDNCDSRDEIDDIFAALDA